MSRVDFIQRLPKHLRKLVQNLPEALPEYREEGSRFVGLDKNESRFGSIGHDKDYSRFPDPHCRQVRERLAEVQELKPEQILLGAGVDVLLDLLMRTLCTVSRDQIGVFTPAESWIKQRATLNYLTVQEFSLNTFFQLPASRNFLDESGDSLKLLILQTPNPITGISLRVYDLIDLLDTFEGFVVVDERGIEFSDETRSLLPHLAQYDNLIVLQDFSEVWGLAAANVAALYAAPTLIRILQHLQYAHPLSRDAQQVVLKALRLPEHRTHQVLALREARETLKHGLLSLNFVKEVWESERNFLLVRFERPQVVLDYLRSEGFIVHLVHEVGRASLEDCIRITVGKPEEVQSLLSALRQLPYRTSRTRQILRTVSGALQKASVVLGVFKKIFA